MFWNYTLKLLEGFGTTVGLFALTLLIALPLGLIISFGSMSKFKAVNMPIKVIVWIVRGTPLMLQLFIVLYVPGLVFKVPINSRFAVAVIAFGLNYAIYFSEIYRSGFESIPKGQYEACRVLGLTRWQTLLKVILPQVVKRIIPPFSNESITLVKDTAIANVISVAEIIWNAKEITATTAAIWPLFYTGIFYLIFNGLLTLLFAYFEKRLSYYKG